MKNRYVSFVTYLLDYFSDINLLKCEKAIFVLQNAFRADQRMHNLKSYVNKKDLTNKNTDKNLKNKNPIKTSAPILRTTEKIQIRAFQQPGFVEALADYFVKIIP